MSIDFKSIVRLRPLLPLEQNAGDIVTCLTDETNHSISLSDPTDPANDPSVYYFDKILSPSNTQTDVYNSVGAPIVDASLKQSNNSVLFSFGVSNSGKSHTLIGSDADPGVLPKLVLDLFGRHKNSCDGDGDGDGEDDGKDDGEANDEDKKKSFSLEISMLEIYNEQGERH